MARFRGGKQSINRRGGFTAYNRVGVRRFGGNTSILAREFMEEETPEVDDSGDSDAEPQSQPTGPDQAAMVGAWTLWGLIILMMLVFIFLIFFY